VAHPPGVYRPISLTIVAVTSGHRDACLGVSHAAQPPLTADSIGVPVGVTPLESLTAWTSAALYVAQIPWMKRLGRTPSQLDENCLD
jgi:hypothetical protein